MTEIDSKQRVSLISLKDNAKPLKNKVPYDQLQPCITSELHQFAEDVQNLSDDDDGVGGIDDDGVSGVDGVSEVDDGVSGVHSDTSSYGDKDSDCDRDDNVTLFYGTEHC